MDPAKITVDLSESAQEKIISTRIRIARNLAGFPLNPGGTAETRVEVAETLRKVIFCCQSDGRKTRGLGLVALFEVYDSIEDEDLKGEMFLHSTMSDEQRQGLIDDHFLFRGADKMQAASGYHEHWPTGRGVFHTKNKQFVNWINEVDFFS